jgi:osmotically-inducible protein OsmY
MNTHKVLSAVAGVMLVAGLAAGCSTTERAGTQMSDAGITSKVKAKFASDPELHNIASIDVDTIEGRVRLSGSADTSAQKAEAEKLARNTDGVRSVDNDIEVSTGRTLGQATDDSVITSKVKAKLTGNMNPFNVDVDTRHGVVTLTGRVETSADKSTAERLARETSGVTSVKNELKVGDDAEVNAGRRDRDY